MSRDDDDDGVPIGVRKTLERIERAASDRTPTPVHGIDPERAAQYFDCKKEGPACELGKKIEQLEEDMAIVKTALAEQRGKADRDRWILKVMMAAIGLATVLLGGASLAVNLLKRDATAATQTEIIQKLERQATLMREMQHPHAETPK